MILHGYLFANGQKNTVAVGFAHVGGFCFISVDHDGKL